MRASKLVLLLAVIAFVLAQFVKPGFSLELVGLALFAASGLVE